MSAQGGFKKYQNSSEIFCLMDAKTANGVYRKQQKAEITLNGRDGEW